MVAMKEKKMVEWMDDEQVVSSVFHLAVQKVVEMVAPQAALTDFHSVEKLATSYFEQLAQNQVGTLAYYLGDSTVGKKEQGLAGWMVLKWGAVKAVLKAFVKVAWKGVLKDIVLVEQMALYAVYVLVDLMVANLVDYMVGYQVVERVSSQVALQALSMADERAETVAGQLVVGQAVGLVYRQVELLDEEMETYQASKTESKVVAMQDFHLVENLDD